MARFSLAGGDKTEVVGSSLIPSVGMGVVGAGVRLGEGRLVGFLDGRCVGFAVRGFGVLTGTGAGVVNVGSGDSCSIGRGVGAA